MGTPNVVPNEKKLNLYVFSHIAISGVIVWEIYLNIN